MDFKKLQSLSMNKGDLDYLHSNISNTNKLLSRAIEKKRSMKALSKSPPNSGEKIADTSLEVPIRNLKRSETNKHVETLHIPSDELMHVKWHEAKVSEENKKKAELELKTDEKHEINNNLNSIAKVETLRGNSSIDFDVSEIKIGDKEVNLSFIHEHEEHEGNLFEGLHEGRKISLGERENEEGQGELCSDHSPIMATTEMKDEKLGNIEVHETKFSINSYKRKKLNVPQSFENEEDLREQKSSHEIGTTNPSPNPSEVKTRSSNQADVVYLRKRPKVQHSLSKRSHSGKIVNIDLSYGEKECDYDQNSTICNTFKSNEVAVASTSQKKVEVGKLKTQFYSSDDFHINLESNSSKSIKKAGKIKEIPIVFDTFTHNTHKNKTSLENVDMENSSMLNYFKNKYNSNTLQIKKNKSSNLTLEKLGTGLDMSIKEEPITEANEGRASKAEFEILEEENLDNDNNVYLSPKSKKSATTLSTSGNAIKSSALFGSGKKGGGYLALDVYNEETSLSQTIGKEPITPREFMRHQIVQNKQADNHQLLSSEKNKVNIDLSGEENDVNEKETSYAYTKRHTSYVKPIYGQPHATEDYHRKTKSKENVLTYRSINSTTGYEPDDNNAYIEPYKSRVKTFKVPKKKVYTNEKEENEVNASFKTDYRNFTGKGEKTETSLYSDKKLYDITKSRLISNFDDESSQIFQTEPNNNRKTNARFTSFERPVNYPLLTESGTNTDLFLADIVAKEKIREEESKALPTPDDQKTCDNCLSGSKCSIQ